ncbi:uncharacterized protein RHO17_005461 [Thomomys bottae]
MEVRITVRHIEVVSVFLSLDKNDPPDLGTEEFKQSKDSNLTTVVVHSKKDISTAEDSGLRAVTVHSNEDISSCTTAHDPCPAPDDGNVTESDILSDTTTKRDELNNNEGNHMKKIANKILLSLSFRWVRL